MSHPQKNPPERLDQGYLERLKRVHAFLSIFKRHRGRSTWENSVRPMSLSFRQSASRLGRAAN